MTTPEKQGGHGGEYAGLGLQFAVSILIFLYAGQWLDRRLDTEPWFMIIGVFTGAGASFYSMYRKLMTIQERDERLAREQRAADQAARDAEAGR
jgi:ATP synthase protein I